MPNTPFVVLPMLGSRKEGVRLDAKVLKELRPRLRRFLGRFRGCFTNSRTRAHLPIYVEGQLGPLERKSIEPMALDAGVAPRTLQQFLSLLDWDDDLMRRRVCEIVQRDHGNEQAIAVIDETTVHKKGNLTAGVQRQWCGSRGKVENCVATVHLGFVAGPFSTLVEHDLYLPASWAEDAERRRKAKIPDDVVYRPKWRIALDILDRAIGAGLQFRWLTGDEGYGRFRTFREGIAKRGLTYVVEIPNSTMGWTSMPRLEPLARSKDEEPRTRVMLGERKARKVSALWERGGPSWTTYRVKDTDKGPVLWEVRETEFYEQHDELPDSKQRLLVAREVMKGEMKYFLANAPASVPVKDLLTVAFSRWNIERNFEDAKGEVGLDHFEVRQYGAIRRHLAVSDVSLLFLAKQTARLRGEKSVVELRAGQAGDGCSDSTRPRGDAERAIPGAGAAQDLILAEASDCGRRLAHEASTSRAEGTRDRPASGHEMPVPAIAL